MVIKIAKVFKFFFAMAICDGDGETFIFIFGRHLL